MCLKRSSTQDIAILIYHYVLVVLALVSTVMWLCLCTSQAGRTEGVSEQLIDSDARALYEAGEGRKGKDCSAFIEILTTRSACHLRKG